MALPREHVFGLAEIFAHLKYSHEVQLSSFTRLKDDLESIRKENASLTAKLGTLAGAADGGCKAVDSNFECLRKLHETDQPKPPDRLFTCDSSSLVPPSRHSTHSRDSSCERRRGSREINHAERIRSLRSPRQAQPCDGIGQPSPEQPERLSTSAPKSLQVQRFDMGSDYPALPGNVDELPLLSTASVSSPGSSLPCSAAAYCNRRVPVVHMDRIPTRDSRGQPSLSKVSARLGANRASVFGFFWGSSSRSRMKFPLSDTDRLEVAFEKDYCSDDCINSTLLWDVLKDKIASFPRELVEELFNQLQKLSVPTPIAAPNAVLTLRFSDFCDMLTSRATQYSIDEELRDGFRLMQKVLLSKNVSEAIENLAGDPDRDIDTRKKSRHLKAWGFDCTELLVTRYSNIIVSMAVLVGMMTLGLSQDIEPDWAGWQVFDVILAAIFLIEVLLKLRLYGFFLYFLGEDRGWNWLDVFVTFFAIVDLVTEFVYPSQDIMQAKVVMVLRILRLARFARLLKLLRTPALRTLASMVSGFLVGVPWLLTVLLFFMFQTYVSGTMVRQVVGPSYGDSLMQTCGSADTQSDFIFDDSDSVCKTHKLIGEEYFGTVPLAMFNTFRCTIGDCFSKSGKSLVGIFSRGYGNLFRVVYAVCMITIIFGVFNIITAMFVDATLSGLKYNDVKKKYERVYEAKYVRRKLEELATRMLSINNIRKSLHSIPSETTFTLEQLRLLLDDQPAMQILSDLDVQVMNPDQVLEVFAKEGINQISMTQFMATLMRLRGEVQKSDLVGCWVQVRSLHEKIDELTRMSVEDTVLAKRKRSNKFTIESDMLACSDYPSMNSAY